MRNEMSWKTPSILSLAICAMALLSFGCTKETNVGGPGAAPGGSGVADREDAGANTFQLVMPSGEIDITQGETRKLEIGIDRGSKFNQTVSVKLMAPMEGLSLNPQTASFSGDKTEIEFDLIAAADAPVGVTNITLIGSPDSGENVNGGMQVRINEK